MEERLKKFAALVDAGSFTRAAAELHVSQPALSTAVAKLERELRSRLLVRGARPLVLTPAGQIAYQTAKGLSVQTDNLRLRLAELSHEQVSLRIGMIDSVADALFAEGVDLEMLKGARVSVVVNNSRYLSEAVERGDLDIAFVAHHPRSSHLLEARPVADEPLAVVCLSGRNPSPGVSLPDFIGYDQPSNTFRLVDEALREFGVLPHYNFYSTSPEVILRLVLLGKGVAALPYLMVREHLKDGRLKLLRGKTLWLVHRPIVAIKRRDKDLPTALRRLIGQTSSTLEELLAEARAN